MLVLMRICELLTFVAEIRKINKRIIEENKIVGAKKNISTICVERKPRTCMLELRHELLLWAVYVND